MTLLSDDSDTGRISLMGETIGMGVLDSGCVTTVCGKPWLTIYMESLSVSDRNSIRYEKYSAKFKFGDGPAYQSSQLVHLPVHIGSVQAFIATHVVACDVPLLISRQSLKLAECNLDLKMTPSDSLVKIFHCILLVRVTTAFLCLGLLIVLSP